MADLNQDGQEDTPQEHEDITKNRRRMAWFFTITVFFVTCVILFYIPVATVASYDTIVNGYFFLAASVILGYMGTSTAMSYWQNRK